MIRMLVDRGKLDEEAARGWLSWPHSRLSIHQETRAEAWDAAALERLCRCLVHPPIALGRLQYHTGQATYRGRRPHPITGQDSLTLDPLERPARLCQHIPQPGFHMTRPYGACASRTRACRARQRAAAAQVEPESHGSDLTYLTPSQRERRRQ